MSKWNLKIRVLSNSLLIFFFKISHANLHGCKHLCGNVQHYNATLFIVEFLPCDCKCIRSVLLSKSVRLSVEHAHHRDTKKWSTTKILTQYKRAIHLVFWQEEWLMGATWNFRPYWPRSFEDADFQSIFARRTSAVTPTEKKFHYQKQEVHYTTRFPVNIVRCRTLPLSPRGGLETQNSRFPSKSALISKKVCYKVPLCENRQQKSCKAFFSLSSRAKWLVGDVPFYVKIGRIWPTLQRRFPIIFARSASVAKIVN